MSRQPPPRPLPRPSLNGRRLSGAVAPGTVIEDGDSVTVLQPTAGLRRLRVRVKAAFTGDATILVAPADQKGIPYTGDVESPVSLTTATEELVDVELAGENYVAITLTAPDAAPLTVTFLDVMGLSH